LTTHNLMVKTHNVTGLKYLCYSVREGDDLAEYKGSGTFWRRHLHKHGKDIRTEYLISTEDVDEFKTLAIETSKKFDIVNSSEWANLRIEQGDGGSNSAGKMWLNDGKKNIYIKQDESIPEGFVRGRINCAFNDPEKQREFSKRVDREQLGEKLVAVNAKKKDAGIPIALWMKDRGGDLNPASKKINTPFGIFVSVV